ELDEVSKATLEFVNCTTWTGARGVLDRQPKLLTPLADVMLRQMAKDERSATDRGRARVPGRVPGPGRRPRACGQARRRGRSRRRPRRRAHRGAQGVYGAPHMGRDPRGASRAPR